MNAERVLGNNVRLLLNSRKIDKQDFADALGNSLFDVEKLCDARLFSTEEDISDIAEYFHVSTDELMISKPEEEYRGEGFLHCMGNFKSQENKEKILNIFDMYCDIKEALQSENKKP